MSRSHIKIAHNTLNEAIRRKKEEKLPSLLRHGNYRFHIIEAPGVTLEYFNIQKKAALNRAFQVAKNCTFNIEEIPFSRGFTSPFRDTRVKNPPVAVRA